MSRALHGRQDGRIDLEDVGAWSLIVLSVVAIVAGLFIGQARKADHLCRDGIAAYCQEETRP
jgi:hypothetical protein